MIALCRVAADVRYESCSGRYKIFIAFCTFAIDIKPQCCSRRYEVVIALCGFAADDRSESCRRKYEIVIALCGFAADVRSVLAVANVQVAGCIAPKKQTHTHTQTKTEDPFNPLFKEVLYSMLWVGEFINMQLQ